MSEYTRWVDAPDSNLLTLQALVASGPDGIVVADEEGRMVLVNARAEEMFGYEPGSLLGHSIEVLIPDSARAAHGDHRARYAAAPRPRPMGAGLELAGRRRNGAKFPIDVSLTAVVVDGRRLFAAFVRDISARVESDNALRASEERFKSLVDSVPDYAILTLDPEGRITSWGVGAQRLKGYTAAEVEGRPLEMLYTAEDCAAGVPHQNLVEAAAKGQLRAQGWRVRRDGSRFWADVSLTAIFEANRKLLGYAKVTRDLTEQRVTQTRVEALGDLSLAVLRGGSSEDVLALAARRARHLVDGILSWAAVPTDDGGHIVVAGDGPGAAELGGFRLPQPASAAANALAPATSMALEWVAGSPFSTAQLGPVVLTSVADAGHVFGLLGVARAAGEPGFSAPETRLVEILAAQAAAALALRAARLEVERLSVTEDQERIARDLHDTVIQRLFATAMSLQSTLRAIESEAVRSRIDQCIDDLDDTIRSIRTTIFGLQPRRDSKRSVRQRVLEVTAEAADGLGFEPAVRFEGAVDALVGLDIVRELVPTVREALSNTARHAHATKVTVTLQAGDHVTLTVLDNGIGVADAASPGGHGLANMGQRARSLGGTFDLESTPGAGAKLQWRVPSATPTRTPTSVLIVDDHQMVAQSMVRLLADEPDLVVVGVAHTAESGLALAREHHPDVVVMDYGLPDLDGATASRQIRASSPATSVILVTGTADGRVLRAAVDAGCSGYIEKSRGFDELAKAVRRIASGETLLPPAYQ